MSSRPSLRVLIVEDRDDDVVLLLEELRRAGYDILHTRVETESALRRALESDWDILLSDFSLPGMTAHDVLAASKALRPDLPCIVISGTMAEESAVDVLRAGASDFVVKERMTRLLPAIERELREAAERRRFLQSEESLRQMRERMQFALETVGVGTWESQVASGVTTWSDVMERLHGLAPGTFAGTFDAFLDAVHPDDRERVKGLIARSASDRADTRVEYRARLADGSIHWIAGIGRTMRDEQGSAMRAAGVAMDITAQRLLEEQVRQSQKMESIGNLAGGVAHDFNNLLTVILGECELMAPQFSADADTSAAIDAIRGAAVSASALTQQLLTFSRRQVVSPRLLDLNDAITSFARILRRLVEESVHIEFTLAPSVKTVRADPGQIEQVLLNLVANARDAMPDGGRITIATQQVVANGRPLPARESLPPGSYVELAVTDTGSGITAEVQARLFEPFFTTKPAGSGTGLGLATVHGIVTQSNGHIFVQSVLGTGTTFTVYLPNATAADDDAAAVPAAAGTMGGSETILVIEDNTALRRLTERILRTHGYTVLGAANGAQATEIASGHRGDIAVVLTDVVMPDNSGPAVADTIRAHRPATKVVFMSGYTAQHDRVAGQAFLQKPFTSKQLLSAVRNALG
jgi:PAS domain S-box-containing protein